MGKARLFLLLGLIGVLLLGGCQAQPKAKGIY